MNFVDVLFSQSTNTGISQRSTISYQSLQPATNTTGIFNSTTTNPIRDCTNISGNYVRRPENTSSNAIVCGQELRSVAEIPEEYQSIFREFPYFNRVQSKVFDDVFHTDKSLVVSAPTGSGKTVICELAIVRLLARLKYTVNDFKIVYMAPIKALCSERYEDWKMKFGPFGLECIELTGDTEIDDYGQLRNANLIFTTPEKWDSMTRRWRDNWFIVQIIKLFFIDEVHVLSDETRGATVEAVISRMMTVHAPDRRPFPGEENIDNTLRFVALSATIPNAEDFAEWLGSGNRDSISHKLSDDLRPVKLRKIVLGYHCEKNWSEFKFDLSLNYKLSHVIATYSDCKPTLVFCSTRKGAMQTASILVKEAKFLLNMQHKEKLRSCSFSFRDAKLKELIPHGVGFHHAGLEVNDRKLTEELFVRGELPILMATSTLAMGVNLPAHLVIVKSTTSYVSGLYVEYSDAQILQMIGRAGRPQFDTHATAVIMTKTSLKAKYESFLGGTQLIESSLHKSLAEYMNAEIVLNTITDISVAVQWVRCTFLYVRIMKNPKHYGLSPALTKSQIEQKLQEMCLQALNSLASAELVKMDDEGFDLKSTEAGKLMARYCISLQTMKQFGSMSGTESLSDLVTIISSCKEFAEIQLRTSDKKTLNTLNKDKFLETIRFPMTGRIRTREMKINCLIQSVFGCITIQELALNQETLRIMRIGQRLSKCLAEYVSLKTNFTTYLNAVLLAKCFRARLWENSKYVAKQLDRIGITLANALVNAGLTTFRKIENTNPRELEITVNRHPPFGNHIKDAVQLLPKYEIDIKQTANHNAKKAELNITVRLVNYDTIVEKGGGHSKTSAMLVIGDNDNKVVFKQRLLNSNTPHDGKWCKKLVVFRSTKGNELDVHLLSEFFVGLDVTRRFSPIYAAGWNDNHNVLTTTNPNMITEDRLDPEIVPLQDMNISSSNKQPDVLPPNDTGKNVRRTCGHRCNNKDSCRHQCCKTGVVMKTLASSSQQSKRVKGQTELAFFLDDVHTKSNRNLTAKVTQEVTAAALGTDDDKEKTSGCNLDLGRFTYRPWRKTQDQDLQTASEPITIDEPQSAEGAAISLSSDDDGFTWHSDDYFEDYGDTHGDDRGGSSEEVVMTKWSKGFVSEDFQDLASMDWDDFQEEPQPPPPVESVDNSSAFAWKRSPQPARTTTTITNRDFVSASEMYNTQRGGRRQITTFVPLFTEGHESSPEASAGGQKRPWQSDFHQQASDKRHRASDATKGAQNVREEMDEFHGFFNSFL